jgi:hypothetical protein
LSSQVADGILGRVIEEKLVTFSKVGAGLKKPM